MLPPSTYSKKKWIYIYICFFAFKVVCLLYVSIYIIDFFLVIILYNYLDDLTNEFSDYSTIFMSIDTRF